MNISRRGRLAFAGAALLLSGGTARAFTLATHALFSDGSGKPQYYQDISTTTPALGLILASDDPSFPLGTSASTVTVTFPYVRDGAGNDVTANVQISFDDFATAVPSTAAFVQFAPGTSVSSATFRFRVTGGVTGPVNVSLFATGLPQNYGSLGLNVLGNVSFTGVSVRNDPAAAPAANAVITPDHDGLQDGALIRGFLPGLPSWQVVVFSTGDVSKTDPLATYYAGSSYPEVTWYGYDNFNRVVPSGDYNVRFQTAGGAIVDDSLTVTVNSAFIKGRINPLVQTQVNANGPGGGGYYQIPAGTDFGDYAIWGLKAGQSYNVQIAAPGYVSQNLNAVAANTDLGTRTFTQGAQLRVSAVRSLGAAGTNPEVWAGLNANTTDYASNSYATIHFPAETAASDNGDYYAPSTMTLLSVPPNQTINLQLSVYNYGNFPLTVTSPGAGSSLDVAFTGIAKKATLSGIVSFSTAPLSGAWVSINGTRSGDGQPTVFGGGFVNAGSSSTTYQVFGVSTGTWTFQAFSQGYKAASTGTFVGASDVVLDFPPIDAGGVISGFITLLGDSSSAPAPQFGSSCSPGQIPVSVNANSPTSFTGAWTQLCIATQATPSSAFYRLTGLDDGAYEVYSFLPGFQLTPPGRRTATVSGSSATLHLDYQRLSGAVQLSVQLPAGDLPGLVSYDLHSAYGGGPDGFSQSGSFTGTTVTVQGVGTGVYEVRLQDGNPGRGLVKRAAVSVLNGSTSLLAVDMRDVTYAASGTVSLNGSIVLPAPWSVSVSSAAGLAQAAALNGSTAPVVQVFSLALSNGGINNGQAYQQVRAVPVAGQSYATFTVTGLPAGTYLFQVKTDLDPPCPSCSGPPEFGTTSSVVLATADVSGIALTLSNGADVAGAVVDPSGDAQVRQFDVSLNRDDNALYFSAMASLNGGGTGAFQFQHVADGSYTLEVRERTYPGGPVPKFAALPAAVKVAGGSVLKNVTLVQGGAIVGQLRDADSNTMITSFNAAQFLPDNFFLQTQANPWTPGGSASMERCDGYLGCTGNVYISSVTGQFAIYRILPGQVYDVNISGFQDTSGGGAAKGQKTYTPVSLSGVRVEAGQTVDLGIVDLSQGVALSGNVTLAGSTTPLANVRVEAFPSQVDGGDQGRFAVQAFTDQSGNYTLRGVDRARRFYDVVAAPRFENNDVGSLLSGPRYGEETRRNVDVPAALSLGSSVDFAMTPANASLSGHVATIDGGPLQQPFGDHGNSGVVRRQAAVTMHLVGSVVGGDNPLGEIEEATDENGDFTVAGLKPGTYQLRCVSVGYVTDLRTAVVAAGANSAGTVTLKKGASLSGTIRKPNGSYPSTTEVKMIAGVDQDFSEFAFARLTADESSSQVSAYQMDGFKPGVVYSLVAGSQGDEIVRLSTVSFSASTETKTLDLVYKPAPAAVFVNQSRSGNTYTFRFFSTHKLRNVTADDNDLAKIVTCPTCGLGTGAVNYSSSSISGSRDTLNVVYDGVPSESSFDLRVAFTSAKSDPESATGANFAYDNTFRFYAGVGASRLVNISNALGGDCTLEGTSAGGDFTSGTFSSTSTAADLTDVLVGVRSTTAPVTSTSFASPAARARAAVDAARRLGPAAYPSPELFQAVAKAPDVSQQVFSNFYDVFLPAGVSHSLKKDALITLKYSDAVPDPSLLNIYYFDPGNQVYLLEASKRQIDAANKTITVAVRHLSTFVVMSGHAPVLGTDVYAGGEVLLTNFPNPFNLKPKTVTLAKNASPVAQAIEGTEIRCALPLGKSGTIKIDVYDAAGNLVRTLTEPGTGGAYNYFEWDGKNDGGKKVASGVYIARFTLNNGDERFFKMAVIK